ncbi:MAG: RNA pseudouridine synthase [Treponemataceae bacterium]
MNETRILYVDKNCVVVDKRAGDAVEGGSASTNDLKKALAKELAGKMPEGAADVPVFVEAAHRLDVPVTGCVLFARTQEALAFLDAAFAKGTVKKLYWAIAERSESELPKESELTHYIYFDHKTNKSHAFDEAGVNRKKAVLRFRTLGEGDRYLFIEVELVTGRHHQIRAQLAAAGLKIKGDLKYGARRSEKNGGIRLHCRYLSFPDPVDSGHRIEVTAPIPEADALWTAFETAAAAAAR